MTWTPLRTWPLVTALALAASGGNVRADERADFFERDVRPVLVAKCLECHSDEAPEGGLRLSSRAGVLQGGQTGPAAVAGRPADSLLVRAVEHRGKLKMPPDGRLSDAEVKALATWIEIGLPWSEAAGSISQPADGFVITAADRQHWSFRPLVDPPLPAVGDGPWPRTSLDHFVLERMESAGAGPLPQADRRTLLRRAYFDLIGLPPTFAEVQAFDNDPRTTQDALRDVVDRLLASPRYGERWGRHWLDVARFADTKDGVLMYGDDRIRPFAYTYRDYVIRAFNDDTPFDRFIHEQLAADLIEPPVEPWRLAAMGFLTLGRMFDNNVHDIIDDQIDTVTRGLLGLTVSCARCHDHKYDPISTADYYSLYGVFASSEAPLELPLAASVLSPEAAEFEKDYAAKHQDLRAFRDEQYQSLTETARQRVGDYLIHVATTKPDPLESAIYFLSLAPEELRPPIIARWRRLFAQPQMADDAVFAPWHALLTGDADAGALESERVAAARQRWESLPSGTQPGQLNPLVRAALGQAELATRADVARTYGDLLRRIYDQSQAAESGSASASTPPVDEARQQLLDLVMSRESPLFFPKSQTRRYMSREKTDQFGGKLKELDRLAVKSPQATPRGMVLNDAESVYEPRIFVRGNATQLGRGVPRQFLEIVAGSDRQPFGVGSGRLDLARAITDPGNPLTARVFVNRVWMHHFGEPLVSSPSDFGKRSAPPLHCDLLDHLATQFIQGGWSLKNLHRQILLSATWQQSTTRPEIRNVDQLLSPRRQRLDFEAMRDTLLAVSGQLEQRSGGRPVDITDPGSRSRTVYGLVDRQSLPGVFRAFDFGSPDQSVERRPRTMTPQHTLFALNSPFACEQAKALVALPEVAAAETSKDRLTALFGRILQREPTADELSASEDFLSEPADPGSALTRWEQLAQVLICSNELIYVD